MPGAIEGMLNNGPRWHLRYFPHSGYGWPQLYSPWQFLRQGPSSPGVPWVHLALPEYTSIIQPITSSSTPQGHHSGAAEKLPINLPIKRPPEAAEPCQTNHAGLHNVSLLPVHFYAEYNTDNERNDQSNLGSARGKAQTAWSTLNSPWNWIPKRWGGPC